MWQAPASLSILETRKEDLCNDLKIYCMAQQALWQMIPWLLTEAYGRMGYNAADPNAHAYESGYWQIWHNYGHEEMCIACVDLATGKLVDPDTKQAAPTTFALLTIADNLCLVDVNQIVTKIEQESWRDEKPEWKDGGLKALREKLRAQWHIEPRYLRKKHTGPQPIIG